MPINMSGLFNSYPFDYILFTARQEALRVADSARLSAWIFRRCFRFCELTKRHGFGYRDCQTRFNFKPSLRKFDTRIFGYKNSSVDAMLDIWYGRGTNFQKSDNPLRWVARIRYFSPFSFRRVFPSVKAEIRIYKVRVILSQFFHQMKQPILSNQELHLTTALTPTYRRRRK